MDHESTTVIEGEIVLTPEEMKIENLEQQCAMLTQLLQHGNSNYEHVVKLLMVALNERGPLDISLDYPPLHTTHAIQQEPILQTILMPGQTEPQVTGLRVTLVEIEKEESQ